MRPYCVKEKKEEKQAGKKEKGRKEVDSLFVDFIENTRHTCTTHKVLSAVGC